MRGPERENDEVGLQTVKDTTTQGSARSGEKAQPRVSQSPVMKFNSAPSHCRRMSDV